jgi:hypothetical protein
MFINVFCHRKGFYASNIVIIHRIFAVNKSIFHRKVTFSAKLHLSYLLNLKICCENFVFLPQILRCKMYVHERDNWTDFVKDNERKRDVVMSPKQLRIPEIVCHFNREG